MRHRPDDVTITDQTSALLAGQRRILELIAIRAPLKEVLEAVARLIERRGDGEKRGEGLTCAILRYDATARRLRCWAAPSLPEEYHTALSTVEIGPESGSCGAAIFRREPVIVVDTMRDPLWTDLRPFAERFGLRSSWSTPIIGDDDAVLGTFAVHFPDAHTPTQVERDLVAVGTYLARCAIEHDNLRLTKVQVMREQAARMDAEESQRRLIQTLESITDAFFALDREGRFTYLNHVARGLLAQIYGEPNNLLGRTFETTLGPLVGAQFALQYRRVIIERKPLEFETYYAKLHRWFEVRAYPSEEEVSVYFRDVTERKRAEESLHLISDASAKLSTTLNFPAIVSMTANLGVPVFADRCTIFLKGADGRVSVWESVCAESGDREALDVALRYFLDDPDWDNNPLGCVLGTGLPMVVPVVSTDWLARQVWNEEYAQAVARLNPQSYMIVPLVVRGQVLGALGFGRTRAGHRFAADDLLLAEELARRSAQALENARLYSMATVAQQGLRRQLDFTQALAENIAIGIYAVDRDGHTTFVNPAAARILGWSAAELMGRPAHQTVHHKHADGTPYPVDECPITGTREQGRAFHCDDDLFVRKDGSFLPVSYTATPIVSNGEVQGAVVAFEDVSVRKRTEEERARLEAAVGRERSILLATTTGMQDGLVVVDRESCICYYNPRAAEILGVPHDEVLGRRLDDLLPRFRTSVENPEEALAAFAAARANVQKRPRFEVTFRGPPSQDHLILLFPVVDAQGERIGGAALLRDVTLAKHLATLQERERIAMDLHDGVIQSLYGVSLGLGTYRQMLDADREKAADTLRLVGEQIDAVVQSIRNYIFDLRMNRLGAEGLRAGLVTLAEEARVNALIFPEVSVDDTVEKLLESSTIVDLLQIAREATSNIIRHARASAIRIRVRREGDRCVVIIRDNGRGFDPQGPRSTTGQGLRNMAERTRGLGGRLGLESSPGKGTTVRLEIPLGSEGAHGE